MKRTWEYTDRLSSLETEALECVSELDIRMKSIESSSHEQSTWNEIIHNDLADISARLATVENEIKVAEEGERKATEGQKIGRSLRRQQ
ncbi:hypothetical protein N7467_005313 [Penicillium canescens]|nr:hypothetical protein N7467_005313 [Penicillium canescens]